MNTAPLPLPSAAAIAEVQHWGPSRAALDGRPPVVRVAELVCRVMAANQFHQARAAEAVLDALERDRVQLFLMCTDGDAAPIEAGAFIGGVAFRSEALALLNGEPVRRSFTGPDEALAWLRYWWVEHGNGDLPLDGVPSADWCQSSGIDLGRFAVLESDAHALLTSQSVEPEVAAALVAKEKWAPGERKLPAKEQLRKELLALREANPRNATSELAKKYGVNRSTIQRALPEMVKREKVASPFAALVKR